jgi:hypothetical protein
MNDDVDATDVVNVEVEVEVVAEASDTITGSNIVSSKSKEDGK